MDGTLSKVATASGMAAFIGALAFILSGYGYQWGWWELRTAFRTILPAATLLGIAGLVLGLIYFIFIRSEATRGSWLAMAGVFLGFVIIANAFYWYLETRKYPPIHDITTDTLNPPEFDAIVSLRADAQNPVEYGGEEIAEIQKEHYPDIGTLHLQDPPEQAFEKALAAARKTNWIIVAVNKESLTIEATHTLPWFGFKDDIVIRVDTTVTGSKIDVRSVSRIGRGDIGVNAERIRDYLRLIN